MILIGIGSNLNSTFGDRFKNIDLSIKYIEKENLKILKKSSYYETPSYPNQNNPKFINVVIGIDSDVTFENLISKTINIEEILERKKGIRNDPRTCDIDIIDFNKKVFQKSYKSLEYQVPHKSLKLRNFVLYPLQEIDPNWKHPVTNEDINYLIEKLHQNDKKSILKL